MLAIVIPYFKLAFFESTLASLAGQTDSRFKVYIGNDASKEDPSVLLKKFGAQLTIKYSEFTTNLGSISLVNQWERCIELIDDEEWIMILGDDDVLENTCVASFYDNVDEVNSLGCNVIRYSTQIINEKEQKISEIYQHPKWEKSIDFLKRRFKGGTRSSLSEYIFKTKVVKEIGFKNLPLAWHSDFLAVLEFSGFGSVFTINDATIYFRLSGINITSKKDNMVLKNQATFQYYYYLLENKEEFLDQDLRNELLFRLEKTFLDNKKNIYFWVHFTKLYFSKSYFKRYFLFIIKLFLALFRK